MKKIITEDQARRLAMAYSDYRDIRVADLEYALDVELAIGASRRLRKIQDEVDIDMTGMNRYGDDKLLALEAKLETLLRGMGR